MPTCDGGTPRPGTGGRRALGSGSGTTRGRCARTARPPLFEAGRAKAAALRGEAPDPVLAGNTLSLEEGWLRASDPATGKWPANTPYRRESERSMEFVMSVLGRTFPWVGVKKAEFRRIWRAKIQQLQRERGDHRTGQGHRGVEVVIARFLTVAAWLRNEELIPVNACIAGRDWKSELKGDWRDIRGETRDPDPHRPRYTPTELAAILAKAPAVDPRLVFLAELGLELRPGQVGRCRRCDLDLEARTLRVHGQGKKRGATVELTDEQLRVVRLTLTEGYLAPLEAEGGDYPLFPQGKMIGKKQGRPRATERHRTAAPVSESTFGDWWREAERLAKVEHVRGRGLYGGRRLAVDESEGLDMLALQELGGWTDEQTPNRIYRERERKQARGRAREFRAGWREKLKGLTPSTVTETVTTSEGEDGPGGGK